MTDSSTELEAPEPIAPGALGEWWRQGLRSAFLLRPAWRRLQVSPLIIACLVIVPSLANVLVERLYVEGEAVFHWPALLTGWFSTVVAIWVCWLLVPRPRRDAVGEPASAVALFAMFAAQALTLTLVSALIFVPLARQGDLASTAPWQAATAVAIAWYAAAQLALVWRSGMRRIAPRLVASLLLLCTLALDVWVRPVQHWYALGTQGAEASAFEPIRLTQELLELQPQLLQSGLQALKAGQPGTVDVYAITFAPYADEDVFLRESSLVATVMQERFGAAGRTLQLVNHRSTLRERPWATPLNLQRAIQHAGKVMDRDEDVLFIHLTSHGARAGELTASFFPLAVDSVTPQALKGWLDEAGIRNRVVSVSACYSGSWIEPLADADTLVMTAADANNTSYGCGKKSTLTYFGRALFDEQLRSTWSFEQAHAAARTVIEEREREAGKSDGYSNPQIRVGERIRDVLARLEAERAKAKE